MVVLLFFMYVLTHGIFQFHQPSGREYDKTKCIHKLSTRKCDRCSGIATGWQKWNSRCYSFSDDALDKRSSQTACELRASSLVEVETIQEHNLLKQFMMNNRDYWAGLTKTVQNEYHWTIGGDIVLTSLWEQYMPDDYDDCVRFRALGQHLLNDRNCSIKFHYICEKQIAQDVTYYCKHDQIQTNLALGHQTHQSSILNSSTPSHLAVDGSLIPLCASTDTGSSVWWQVDLQEHFLIHHVVIHKANCCESGNQTGEIEIRLYFLNPETYYTANYTVCATLSGTEEYILCSERTVGRWLRIIKTSVTGVTLTLCEVEVYGSQCEQTSVNDDTCDTPILTYNVTLSGEQTTQFVTTTQEESTTHTDTVTASPRTTTHQYSTGNSTQCRCHCHSHRNVSEDELMKQLQEIIKELKVDTKSTSLYKRSLISVDDKRPSAKVVGSLGVIILVIVLLFLVTGDVIHLITFVYSLLKNRLRCIG